MNCERCSVDAPVHHCDVDGFAYYLCVTCLEDWDAVSERPDTVAPADVSTRSAVR